MADRINVLTDFHPEMFDEMTAPLVSLYMPTHLFVTGNQQDLLEYKNLVSKTETELAKNYNRRDYEDIIEGLNELFEDGNRDVWRYTKKGLAILTEGPKTYVYHLDYPVESLAVVSDSYHILPLIRNFQYGAHYYVLALSADTFDLYEGDFHSLKKVPMPEGIERRFDQIFDDFDDNSSVMVSTHVGSDAAFSFGQNSKSDVVEKEILKFFYYVDHAMNEHFVDGRHYPVILASLPRHQALYRQISSIPTLVDGGIEKPFDSMDEEEVLLGASEIITDIQESSIAKLIDRFGIDQARELASTDPAVIAFALLERKVSVLFVEEGKCIPGSFDITTGKLTPPASGKTSIDGLLDDFAQRTYLQGGEVYVVEKDMMPSDTGVAALFRY